MENNELMVNEAVQTVESVMESATENRNGFGFGEAVIGGLALYGAIQAVKGVVHFSVKAMNWAKAKQALKKAKPAEEAEDLTKGTDVENDYKIS